VRARSTAPAAARAFLCEKHLMNSAACVSGTLATDGSGRWRTLELVLETGEVGTPRPGLGLAPPVFLTLAPPGAGAVIDIAGVALLDAAGVDLVRNGRFAADARGWFFTDDDHQAWHLKNLWAFVLFEQGLVGVAGFALLTLYIVLRVARAVGTPPLANRPPPGAALAVAGALAGLHVLALTDAVLDAPRIAAMVLLVYGAALGVSRPLRQGVRGDPAGPSQRLGRRRDPRPPTALGLTRGPGSEPSVPRDYAGRG
jgi:hypothetical protein